MARYGYDGSVCPRWLAVAMWEGWRDAAVLQRFEQLYRRPRWKVAAYRLGWLAGRFARRTS